MVMQLSKSTLEILIDLIENKISAISMLEQFNVRDQQLMKHLQLCKIELYTLYNNNDSNDIT